MLHSNKFWNRLIQRDPEVVACWHKSKSYTCRYIKEKSILMASELRKLGFEKDDKVVMALEPGPEFIIALYAGMLLGGKIAIIDPHMGRVHYQAMLKQFEPQWAFMDSRLILLQEHPILRWLYLYFNKEGIYLPSNRKTKKIACGISLPILSHKVRFKTLIKPTREHVVWNEIDPNEECMIVYTSGTTGIPKAVVHTYASLTASLDLLSDLILSMQVKRIATHLPHFILLAIQSGLEAFIWSEKMNASARYKYLIEHNIDCLFGPPSEILALVKYCEHQKLSFPESVRHILLGSAPVYPSFLKRLKSIAPIDLQITCIYGMTENLIVSTISGAEKLAAKPELGDLVGTPVRDLEYQISEAGNLLIRSPQLCTRYFHEDKHMNWHDTGDRAIISDGQIYLTGRSKNMIIHKNTNIYPELYEPSICQIEGVEDAALVGIYDESIEDERVILTIQTVKNDLNPYKIMKELQSGPHSIHRDALPDKILFMNIPRKGRQQKLDRESLKKEIQWKTERS